MYSDLTAYPVGSFLEVDGRNDDDTWWRVKVPNSNDSCWISSILLELSGDLSTVPVLPAPPTPTPTLTLTPTDTLTPPVVTSPGPPPSNN